MNKKQTKDWTGSSKSGYLQLGSSNNSDTEREERDFYATDPEVVKELLKHEKFNEKIWEPACGMLHISNELEKAGYKVRNSDIVNRLDNKSIEIYDFLEESGLLSTGKIWDGDIITNPPYKFALEFTQLALDRVKTGAKVAMFLKIQFLEGKARKEFFQHHPPKTIYVCSERVACAKNGEFMTPNKRGEMIKIGSAVCYAWFVWEKGYKGDPSVKWIM